MIEDYIKTSKKIYLYDNKKGIIEENLNSNSEQIINLQNDIEILNNALLEVQEQKEEAQHYLEVTAKEDKFIFIFAIVFALIASRIIIFTENYLGMHPTIGLAVLSNIATWVYSGLGFKRVSKSEKKKKQKIEECELVQTYIKEQINSKELELQKALNNASMSNNAKEENVSLISYNRAKKDRLEHELDLLIEYSSLKDAYQKAYQSGNLEQKISDSEDLSFVRELISKDLSK